MSDDTQEVEAGSTGAYEPEETSTEETTTADATATAETTAETGAQGAEVAAEASTADTTSETESDGAEVIPDANESRTGFLEKGKQGDECICPDGRKGTVHKFDNGLICIPNADQA